MLGCGVSYQIAAFWSGPNQVVTMGTDQSIYKRDICVKYITSAMMDAIDQIREEVSLIKGLNSCPRQTG